jgi:NitT/TauT family transport system substrate-binding protein
MSTRYVRNAAGALLALVIACGVPLASHAAEPTKIKFILNWKWEGPQAWFFIAQDKGWFKEEGVEVEFDQGAGSAAAVTRVASGAYDAGFGDINSLIQFKADHPDNGMKAVYMLYNVPPFVIVSLKEKGIESPKDLEGKVLGASADDAAFKLFPGFAKTAGIDTSKIEWQHMAPNLRQQLLVRGDVDAIAGYHVTVKFGLRNMQFDPAEANFMRYSDHGMDLYSNTIIFSENMLKNHPDAVRGFVRALNRAFFHVHGNREEGIDAVMKRETLLKRDIERDKLDEEIAVSIVSPEMKEIGIGDVRDERLERSIAIVADTFGLPRKPGPEEVFDRSFLPLQSDRMLKQ